MKIYNKWIALTLGCLSAVAVQAQENSDTTYVERNVQIEKEYQPEVLESRRLSVELPVSEYPATKEKVSFSNYSNPISLATPFVPTTQADMTIMNRFNPKMGYARVGIGYPLNWLADFWYPLLDKRNDSFTFKLNHNGLYGKGQRNIVTDLGLDYEHRFESVKITSYIGYGNQYFNYYGTDSLSASERYIINEYVSLPGDSIYKTTEFIQRARIGIGLASLETASGWYYGLGLGYKMNYLQNAAIGEHNLLVNGDFEGPVGEQKLRINIGLNTLFYSTPETPLIGRKTTNAVFNINPAYILNWKDGSLQIGAKIYFSTSNGRMINAMPDIKGIYNVKKSIQLYAGVGGEYKVNSLASLLEENRFYNPYLSTIKNSYKPIDLFVGFNVKPMKGMVIDAHLNYGFINDNYYFTNQGFETTIDNSGVDSTVTRYSNRFQTNSINTSQLTIGIRLSYNYKELYRIWADGQYNAYKCKGIENFLMPYCPAWEANLGAEVTIIDNLILHADFQFASQRAIGLADSELSKTYGKLAPVYDLNIGAHYTLKNDITLFIRTNNWLSLIPSLRYDNWYGYENIGFLGLIGASFAF